MGKKREVAPPVERMKASTLISESSCRTSRRIELPLIPPYSLEGDIEDNNSAAIFGIRRSALQQVQQ